MHKTFPLRITHTDSEDKLVVLINVRNPLLPIFPKESTKG